MASQFHPNLDRLMEKLSQDDGFRAHLIAAPNDALLSLGIRLDAHQIPALRMLPAKETIALDRLAVKQKLDNRVSAIPFFLSGRP